jgi:hypothetical protein
MTFLIQTIYGDIVHDFIFYLLDAIKYQNWYNKERVYKYIESEVPLYSNKFSGEEIIPIGTVEFVLEFLKTYYNMDNIKPINIPEELNKKKYLKRSVWDYDPKTARKYKNLKVFVKSKDKIKGYCNILPYDKIPTGMDLLVSNYIEHIDSEWRAFVFNGKLVGLQNYAGDFTFFPDTSLIKEMIEKYTSAPPAYTLDVGINREGTFLIEIHLFASCGLYGFSDYTILPQMFMAAWNYIKFPT